jgi:salicylate hydroxylase
MITAKPVSDRWGLFHRPPIGRWTKGRVTLLGDAAHAMAPHHGQGANQSIEDGMALATMLSQVDAAGVPAALLAYERLRRERVAEVQLGARKHGLRVDSATGDLKTRDAELAAHAEFRKQLYSYDVVPLARVT